MREADLLIPETLLPRIGGMATMPSRAESLRQALPHILPQVDKLVLYLDQYQEVPADLSRQPKITAVLPAPGEKPLGAAGKFAALRNRKVPCLYFGFDDDIVYSAGYVEHLAAALRRHRYRAMVGLLGSIYAPRVASYLKDRHTFYFQAPLTADVVVDELGTGTVAFHSSLIDLEPERWASPNMCDLHVMLDAIRQHVQRLCVRRGEGMLRPIASRQDDSLYAKALADDSAETALVRAAMAHYPHDWCQASSSTHTAS